LAPTDPDRERILIRTKLNRPQLPKGLVVRPRLLERLDETSGRRVTLISAPAGYGKTTLISQWLDYTATQSAWLALDRNDGDPDRFLRYVTASVRRVVPEFGTTLESLYSAAVLPPPDYLADTLIGEVAALNHPLVIVLDDFHQFVSEPVLALLSRLVQYQPENLHIVISTRVDPPLPVAKWRVQDWLVEIRATELRFLEEEGQAFFQPFFEPGPSLDTVQMIFKKTEGWVAGMQLARLSLAAAENREGFARNLSGNNRMIADFLVDEVISRQAPEIRDFLAVTSMLERFCAPLCDALMADGPERCDSRGIIFQLEQENLFIVPLDQERIWYRYHHLFKTLLTHHMKAELPEERKTQIFRRAGKWFAGQGLIEEALQYFLAAGDVDDAAALVESALDEVLGKDPSRRTLRRWLDMFPAPALFRQPALAVALVYCKAHHWDRNDVDRLMYAAEGVLNDPACTTPTPRRLKLLADVDALRGFYLYWGRDPEGALKHTLRALKSLPDAAPYAHYIAVLYASLAHAMTGARDKGLQLLAEATSTALSTGSPYARAFLVGRASIHYYAGDLAGVEQVSRQVAALPHNQAAQMYWYLHAIWLLGCVAYERNELDAATAHFQHVERMRYRVNTRPYHDCLIGLALIALARGDTAKAREYADAARDFAVEVKDAYSMTISESFEIRFAIASNRIPAEAVSSAPPVDTNQMFLETPSLTYADQMLCKADPADHQTGLAFAQNAVEQLRRQHNTRQLIQFMAVNAVALHRTGRLDEALKVLEEVLAMAQPLGFLRTFVDRGGSMAELLKSMRGNMSVTSYARKVLDAFGDAAPTTQTNQAHHTTTGDKIPDPTMVPLSRRERTVLGMLETSLTGKEIADRLFISTETVKKHTYNIYRKLNVRTRMQAVSAAKKNGLLGEKKSG